MMRLRVLVLLTAFVPIFAEAQSTSIGYVYDVQYPGEEGQVTIISAFDDVLMLRIQGKNDMQRGDFPEVRIVCGSEGEDPCGTDAPIKIFVDDVEAWVRAWWIDCGTGPFAGTINNPYLLGGAWVSHGPGGGSIGNPHDGSVPFKEGYMVDMDPENCRGKSIFMTLRAEEAYVPYLDPLKREDTIEITVYPWQPFRVSVPGENGGRMFHTVTSMLISTP